MTLWIATGNKGKLAEFKMLLKTLSFDFKSQVDLPLFSQPPENGTTFAENARIKARALKSVVPEEDWVPGAANKGLGDAKNDQEYGAMA